MRCDLLAVSFSAEIDNECIREQYCTTRFLVTQINAQYEAPRSHARTDINTTISTGRARAQKNLNTTHATAPHYYYRAAAASSA